MARVHVWIDGFVQGVFFRATTRDVARGLKLAGWVRNLPDGRVEAVFEGDRASCNKALEFMRTGRSPARVDRIEMRWEDEEESLNGFEIRD